MQIQGTKSTTHVIVIHLLYTISSLVLGYPQEDYVYEDGDYYDEEVVPINQEPSVNFSSYNPQMVTKGKTIEVDAGTTIRLPCEIENLPEDLFQFVIWARLDSRNTMIATGEMILSQDYERRGKVTVDQSGSTLTIAAAEDHDAGQYKCSLTLENAVQEVKHLVKVRGEPLIHSSSPAKLSLSEGDEMTLSCKTSGPASATVRWTKKDGKLPDGKSVVETDVLTVPSVSSNHSGTYKCTAMDSGGRSAEKTVEVEVNYPPHASVSEVVIHALSGDVAELVCKVEGHPSPQVVWSKGGEVVKTDKRKSIHQEGTRHSLTILQLKNEDWGMYTCTARNSQGMAHKDIRLTDSSDQLSNGTRLCSLTALLIWNVIAFLRV